jgi:hypothetical protein
VPTTTTVTVPPVTTTVTSPSVPTSTTVTTITSATSPGAGSPAGRYRARRKVDEHP